MRFRSQGYARCLQLGLLEITYALGTGSGKVTVTLEWQVPIGRVVGVCEWIILPIQTQRVITKPPIIPAMAPYNYHTVIMPINKV